MKKYVLVETQTIYIYRERERERLESLKSLLIKLKS
jgi:hypothetical protein